MARANSGAMRGYEQRVFTARAGSHEITHDVYERGSGPPVVIVQELPGIGTETLRLADRLVESGFSVVLPHLFGPLGRMSFAGNTVRVFCMRREFSLFARRASSPVVDWLRALCADVRESAGVAGVAGVGVIGMCLTGNFAISLMADESVLAAVASQPSLPFAGQSSLHMSDDDISAVRSRLDEHGPMLAFRFAKDPLCTQAKFDAIARSFNDDRERVHLETLPGAGHSVLTGHFVDEEGHPTRAALDSVIRYFRQKLVSERSTA